MDVGTTEASSTASQRDSIWGTTLTLVVTDPALLDEARTLLDIELDLCSRATSRFDASSELSRLNANPAPAVAISSELLDYLLAARRGVALSGGLVDPTVYDAMVALGYDRDFDAISSELGPISTVAAPGFDAVEIDTENMVVRRDPGVRFDLGATSKAYCADRATGRIAASLGCGALVDLGGDLAAFGPPPQGGWVVGITASAKVHDGEVDCSISIQEGGVASSSTTVRAWGVNKSRHHLIDPRTGNSATVCYDLITVVAGTCLDANIAATAGHLWGKDAPYLLAQHGLGARFVEPDGTVIEVGSWPRESA